MIENGTNCLSQSISDVFVIPGPDQDGIDHDFDKYFLLLSPTIQAVIDDRGNLYRWKFKPGIKMNTITLRGKELKNPALMTPSERSEVQVHKLDGLDFAQILSTNPFSGDPNAAIDISRMDRYKPLTGETLSYVAPSGKSSPVTKTVTSDTSLLTQSKVEVGYDVGLSVGVEGAFGPLFSASLKATGSLKLSSSSSVGSSRKKSESASLTLAPPSANYDVKAKGAGGHVEVYWDVVYRTFVFAFGKEQRS
jgi:hypothetical protein